MNSEGKEGEMGRGVELTFGCVRFGVENLSSHSSGDVVTTTARAVVVLEDGTECGNTGRESSWDKVTWWVFCAPPVTGTALRVTFLAGSKTRSPAARTSPSMAALRFGARVFSGEGSLLRPARRSSASACCL